MKDQMIHTLRSHAVGCMNLHKTNIDVYMSNPTGIGEHSDIMEAVQAELDKMAVHEDRLSMLRYWDIPNRSEEEANEQESSE